MSFLIEKEFTWKEFIQENPMDSERRFIYRGHSNEINASGDLIEWELISSFNRYYSNREHSFSRFLGQQLEQDLFNSYYKNYKWVNNNNLANTALLPKLLFLQHYGIPTCLIDFTYNPLVALYFALSSMKIGDIHSIDNNGNRCNFSNNSYLSIYRIDYEKLQVNLPIKTITETDGSLAINYYDLIQECNYSTSHAHIGLILNPLNITTKVGNYNLKAQQGCFILYDTYELGANPISLDSFLTKMANEKGYIDQTIIHYKIPWNSVLSKQLSDAHPRGLYPFLKSKNISGKILFNDYQGLKYDLKFFYEI